MERHALTEDEWKRIEPLLPPQNQRKGRRRKDHRRTIEGMTWIAKTRGPWRDLPSRYEKWKTAHDRFRKRDGPLFDVLEGDLEMKLQVRFQTRSG